jgi:NADPH2:quinone reductase
MKALQISQFGSPATLRTVPVPQPGPGEVLVRTAACGLNFADLLMSEGRYQDTPRCRSRLAWKLPEPWWPVARA